MDSESQEMCIPFKGLETKRVISELKVVKAPGASLIVMKRSRMPKLERSKVVW